MSKTFHDADTRFYAELSKDKRLLPEVLADTAAFHAVPAHWHVVVVDVESSTQAVKNGLHHQVNLAATGSIIAVLNLIRAFDEKLKIPYFFGGDGATFILPPVVLDDALSVLERYRVHILRTVYLTLRVGSVRVDEAIAHGGSIRITKFRVNDVLTIPLVLGTGLKAAERLIKSYFIDEAAPLDQDEHLVPDLTGMECRWEEIAPPADEQRVVCLVAESNHDAQQGEIYAQVATVIRDAFGEYDERQPISVAKLRLNLKISKIREEMYARIGKFQMGYLLKNWLITVAGKFYFMYFKEGKEYVEKVRQLSYTLMIDGTFNCVISGTTDQIDKLVQALDRLEAEQKITYGIHVTGASVLSCYVQDRKSKHIHFVDGTEGGFTTAAKMFKAKLASAE